MSTHQPNVEIMESDIDTAVLPKQSASQLEIVENSSDSKYEGQTWNIDANDNLVPSQDGQHDDIPSPSQNNQLNMLCSDRSACEHSPVCPVRLVLSDTGKVPMSSSDTCEWDPNYQISDSMLAQAGLQEKNGIEDKGNKENVKVNQAIVPGENWFGYSLVTINLLQYVKDTNVYECLIAEKRASYEVHIIIIL